MNCLYHNFVRVYVCMSRFGCPGNYAAAYVWLEEAVKLSDALVYDEPWGWMQPPRHALGALLLEQVIT